MSRTMWVSWLFLPLSLGLLSGCGGGKTDPPPKPSPDAEAVEPVPSEVFADFEGDGSLESVLWWVEDHDPDVDAAVAYVGMVESPMTDGNIWGNLRSDGYLPFVEQLGRDSWLETKWDEGELWCVVPISEYAAVTLEDQPDATGREGEPVLFLWDTEEEPLTVAVYDTDICVAEFDLKLGERDGVIFPVLPDDGNQIDITLRPGTQPMLCPDIADLSEEEELVCEAALSYYENTFDYSPEYAAAEGEEEDGILVHLYDDMGDHIATCGWYVVDPDTLEGYDYISGETLDFSIYAD